MVVAGVLAGYDVEKRGLQLFGDRAALSLADRAVVDLPNRRDFGGGPRQEDLVGDVEVVAGDR